MTSFSVDPDSADCTSGTAYLDFAWTTKDSTYVYFGVDTPNGNAAEAPFFSQSLPKNGSTDNFPDGYNPFNANCDGDSHEYTITAVNSNGTQDSWTITVENYAD